VGAVADFLERDVRDATASLGENQVIFHARVAANALRMVERELLIPPPEAVGEALAGLDMPDEAALATAIRNGRFDDRGPELLACLRLLVGHRVAVAHPGYDDD
jgi:hypothetical protein